MCPPEQRALRDLLRKRLQLVRLRVTNVLSAQNQIWRSTGEKLTSSAFKKVDFSVLNKLDNPLLIKAIKSNLFIICAPNEQIDAIEKTALFHTKHNPLFNILTTMTGVGNILGKTILLETGDISRFAKVGNYASYARCVDSSRTSNNKKKGVNNKRNGNKYLSWAFIEAAHCMIAHCKIAHRFYQRKRQQANGALASKALAHKIARAAYFMMRDQKPYQVDSLFA